MMQMEIARRDGSYYGDDTRNHVWSITDDQGIAAELYVSIERHEIMNVEVREDRRGEGLARVLYETAAREMDIFHAPIGHRTEAGNAFALAVGGDTIEYDCGCFACAPIADDIED
jgi:predicted GNAT family acetyltransferase